MGNVGVARFVLRAGARAASAALVSRSGNDREHDPRGVVWRMVDGLPGGSQFGVLTDRVTGIRVTVEAREIG